MSKGRPSGGIAILWEKNILFQSEPTLITSLQSNRVQGVVFHFLNGLDLLFINVYFPVNKNDFDEFDLLSTLNEITWLCDNCEYNEVLLSGDFNTNFSNNDNNVFSTTVKERKTC